MLRRQTRMRREFEYRKQKEQEFRMIQAKKDRLKSAIDNHEMIPGELRAEAIALHRDMENDDGGKEAIPDIIDDEYRWAGVEDPKLMITTSFNPSSRLKQFAKEVKLIFPTSEKMNRGHHSVEAVVSACKSNGVTDLVILHEHRGEPNEIIVSHLPYGPTAHFTIYNTVMRHEIEDISKMSEEYPHLMFNNFKTRLGKRVVNILKYLFPVPKPESKRLMAFSNEDDYIKFSHYNYKKTENGKDIELVEIGPRFQLKCYKISLGTIDQESVADIEWVERPYLNTARKRRYLSDDDPWER